MRRWAAILGMTMAGVAFAPSARAASDRPEAASPAESTPAPSPPPASDPPARTEWYGAEILATDLGAWALVLLGAQAGDGQGAALALTGGALYVFGGPVVHGAHHRGGAAVGSLVLRLGAPVVGGGLMAATNRPCSASNDDEFCGLGNALMIATGALVGILVAQVVDIAVIARGPAGEPPAPTAGVSILPSATWVADKEQRRVPVFGFSGSF